jgi:anti-anti-sigma factor
VRRERLDKNPFRILLSDAIAPLSQLFDSTPNPANGLRQNLVWGVPIPGMFVVHWAIPTFLLTALPFLRRMGRQAFSRTSGEQMEFRESSLSGVPLLLVSGDLDHEHAAAFEEAVEKVLSMDGGRIFLDLTGSPYIDSGGLAVLLRVFHNLRGKGWLGIVGANANVLRLFDIVGLTAQPSLRLYATPEEARTALDDDVA